MLPANRYLFAAAFGIPVALLAIAGWLNFRQVESQAVRRAAQTTEALNEHALRTLRTHELIIDFVDRYVEGWTWEQIHSSQDLHRLLRHLTEQNRDIASIFLLAPDGEHWTSSRRFPMPPIDGSDRDYFQTLLKADVLYVGRPSYGRLEEDRFFAVARRRSSRDSRFDGLIAVSVSPMYFESFYGGLLDSSQVASLVREDGVLLARHPPLTEPLMLPQTSGFMQAIAEKPLVGSYTTRSVTDGIERLVTYRRIADHPLYTSFQLSRAAVWEAWWLAMLPYVIACLLAMALMMAAIGLATQYARRTAAEARIQEAEQASRAKDLFVAALSHELRNPLAAISNASQAMLRSTGGEAANRAAAEIIARQIGLLRRMLDDLLDTARAVHGKLKLEKRRLDLRPLAATVVSEQLARRPGARVEVHATEGEPWVDGDPVRVKQMLDNLVENALKYGGHNIDIEMHAAGEWVEVVVKDDGEGLAPELLPRLFEPFVQGEQTLDRAQGGLGLGLALVHRLTALHGGTLAAESAGPGTGSRFTLRLPRAEPPARALESSVVGGAQRKRRFLIVDDESDARESLGALLRLEGHEVHVAPDGPAGLHQLAELRPEVALIDIGLPAMDGYEVARRARSLGAGALLIAVTGYGQRADREKALAAGFDAHLTKPFSYEELMRAVERSERRAAA